MTIVVHCRRSPCDVYIGRPSKWGNPFIIGAQHPIIKKRIDRVDAIKLFRLGLLDPRGSWLTRRQQLGFLWVLDHVHELRGKVLGCWCSPLPCHGDVLAALANALDGEMPKFNARERGSST